MKHPTFSGCALVLMILLEKEYSEYIIRIAHKTLIGAVDVRDHYELRI